MKRNKNGIHDFTPPGTPRPDTHCKFWESPEPKWRCRPHTRGDRALMGHSRTRSSRSPRASAMVATKVQSTGTVMNPQLMGTTVPPTRHQIVVTVPQQTRKTAKLWAGPRRRGRGRKRRGMPLASPSASLIGMAMVGVATPPSASRLRWERGSKSYGTVTPMVGGGVGSAIEKVTGARFGSPFQRQCIYRAVGWLRCPCHLPPPTPGPRIGLPPIGLPPPSQPPPFLPGRLVPFGLHRGGVHSVSTLTSVPFALVRHIILQLSSIWTSSVGQ